MGSRGITVLKFVGTVSLGLLTGLSFSLSTVTVPTLLTLPSARTASKAFLSLSDAASSHLRSLSGIATSAFLLAFLLSPRHIRHPYLLYTSLLVLSGRLVTDDRLTPYIFSTPTAASAAVASSPLVKPAKHRSTPAHMEASYEVLGAHTTGSVAGSVAGSVSDSHSDGAMSDGELPATAASTTASATADSAVNGEEVRADVEVFLKKQIARTVISGLAFSIAVIGIWGDGLLPAA
ncbi:hypothetical protein CMQ_7322 [Grosmannia clavigera kw1407]|uniref:Autophagy-related protein 33 n=1 Tax=Grosmannia clavigera (strain kw1407 / UAMH 11150) TaxID=655863 RepID=F0XPG8_GROCL|nr:uncharacterized protein CMQ_7322 [Grosmannia clavigera kw1407]EFX00320.1 hypothetical protein CMQ_7322 [Grosmannia clavigera kw1407]